jgi:hypothetical protein
MILIHPDETDVHSGNSQKGGFLTAGVPLLSSLLLEECHEKKELPEEAGQTVPGHGLVVNLSR